MEAQELAPILSTRVGTDFVSSSHHHENDESQGTISKSRSRSLAAYCRLLRTNRPFALYMLSYITNHLGEWMTYLATLTALHDMQQQRHGGNTEEESSATTVGLLVAVRLLTNVLASPLGGVLADAMDRRLAMILLDLAGAAFAWVFLLAVQWQSPTLIFVATFLQEFDAGLYEPSRSAIVPLLCPTDDELTMATLLTGMAWSVVAAIGSASGGFLVSWLGLQGCFLVDSATYLISAGLMWCVEGNWSVVRETQTLQSEATSKSSVESPWTMVRKGWKYLQQCSWAPLVLLKFTVTWLTMDVLLVAFAERDPPNASIRLGALFASVGVGCLIGPPLADQWTDLKRPGTVQIAAVVSMGISTLACALLALWQNAPLGALCAIMVLRTIGVSTSWINSSLLLQKLSALEFLGRVSSIDFGLALIGESASALVSGRLRDKAGWTPEQVCAWLAILGSLFTTGWIIFTVRGGGAMRLESQNRTGKQLGMVDGVSCRSDPEMEIGEEQLEKDNDNDDAAEEDDNESEMAPLHTAFTG